MAALTGSLKDPTASNQLGGLSTLVGVGTNAVYGPPVPGAGFAGAQPVIAQIGAPSPSVEAVSPDAPTQDLDFSVNTGSTTIPPDGAMPDGNINRTGQPVPPGSAILGVESGGGGGGDTTPPTVSITAPANAATVSGIVTISATASDNVGVVGVQFKLDGNALLTEDIAPPYSISWDTNTTTNTSHQLTAVARDAAGNSTTSAVVTVTVNNVVTDTTPPTVNITAPANAATVGGTVTVSANASDNIGVVGVQFKLDGANLGAEDVVAPYSVSWNTTTATNASHSLTAVARDAAGNSTTSAAISVTVFNFVDTTPPTVSITSPSASATVSGTISVTANASDDVGVVGVQFKLDGANLGAEDTSAPYSVGWDTTTATNTAHTLTAVARDAAGNSATSTAVSVTVSNVVVDTTKPTITITAPYEMQEAPRNTNMTISANASDNIGVVGVQFYVDGIIFGAEQTTPPYTTVWPVGNANLGTHSVNAIARDAAGNTQGSMYVHMNVVAASTTYNNGFLGGNLADVAEWRQDEMFSDLIYTCRGFGDPSDPYMNTITGGVPTGSDGWPTGPSTIVFPRTPDSATTQDYNVQVDADNSDMTLVNPQGWVFSTAPVYSSGTGKTTAVLRAPAGPHGQPNLSLKRAVKNLRVMRPGLAADGSVNLINPAFITYLNNLGVGWVRTMDWEFTNGDLTTNSFATEPTLTTRRTCYGDGSVRGGKTHIQAGGMVAAQMGNKGLWQTIKIAADDQYIKDKGAWCRDNIAAAIELIFELSNEIWNPSFTQYFWVIGQVCQECDGWHGYNSFNVSGRAILSITRAGGVLTVQTQFAHGYSANQTLYCLSIGSLTNGPNTILGVPAADKITFTNAGADNPSNMVTGGSSMIRLINTDLNVYDGAYDVLGSLHPRWITRRAAQMSLALRAVFGDAAMMKRVNPVLMAQTVNSMDQHFGYIVNRLPNPAGYYFRAIGNGWYVFFNSAAYQVPGRPAGIDMRNLNTYNGNTPPAIADYITPCLTDAVRGAKIGNLHDTYAFKAKKYSTAQYPLEVWKYEIGWDANSNPLGTTNGATNHRKLETLFDPGIKAPTKDFLDEQQRFGFERVTWYTLGAIDFTTTAEQQAWPIIKDLASASTSPRVQAISETVVEAQTGTVRNLVAASGTTTIDGRATLNIYPTDWPTGNTYTGSARDFTNDPAYNLTFTGAASKTLTLNMTCGNNGTRTFDVYWNAVKVGSTVSMPPNTTADYVVGTVAGDLGTNCLELVHVGFVGNLGTVNSVKFS